MQTVRRLFGHVAANLTLQYQRAEEAYRQAKSTAERIRCLEEMLRLLPKHKGTDKIHADLRRKLKEARQLETQERSAAGRGRRFRLPTQGAGTVIVIGAPNSGKSRLVAELTNASPEVAPFPFTTREPCPGMMRWDEIDVQLVDTPPVAAGHIEPYVLDFVRSADLVLLTFDASRDEALDETLDLLQCFQDRKTVLSTEKAFDPNDKTVLHVPTLLIATHSLADDAAVRLSLFRETASPRWPVVSVDFEPPTGMSELATAIINGLQLIRIYMKRPGEAPDLTEPLALSVGSRVSDLAIRIHDTWADRLRRARIWDRDGGRGDWVGPDHVLADRDVVELHD